MWAELPPKAIPAETSGEGCLAAAGKTPTRGDRPDGVPGVWQVYWTTGSWTAAGHLLGCVPEARFTAEIRSMPVLQEEFQEAFTRIVAGVLQRGMPDAADYHRCVASRIGAAIETGRAKTAEAL